MNHIKAFSKVATFASAITVAFAFSPVMLIDQPTNIGWVGTLNNCVSASTIETDCDLEEISGTPCHIKAGNQAIVDAMKPLCQSILYRDDD